MHKAITLNGDTLPTISITSAWAAQLQHDLENARLHIALCALSFLPPTPTSKGPWAGVWQAMIDARARGVPIDMHLAAPQKAHPATLQNATMGGRAHDKGMTVHLIAGPRLLHAKAWAIDAHIAYVGSGNLTSAAAGPNRELYARLSYPSAAASLLRWFSDLRTGKA